MSRFPAQKEKQVNSQVSYIAVALIHLSGVLAYQYTGLWWVMGLAIVQSTFATAAFIIASSYVLAVVLDSDEVNYEPNEEHLGTRLLAQIAALITAGQLFLMGYGFFAGVFVLTAVCMIFMLAQIKLSQYEG